MHFLHQLNHSEPLLMFAPLTFASTKTTIYKHKKCMHTELVGCASRSWVQDSVCYIGAKADEQSDQHDC